MSDNQVDITGYLGFMYSILIVLCIVIVVYYAEPGFPWHTYLTLIVGYFVSFGVLLLVPIDIAVVIVDRRSAFPLNDPTYNNHVKTLSAAYSTFFTIILIFGSFVLVFEEYYNTDGYFTLGGKLASSLYRALIDTSLGVVAGIIILSILLSQKVVGSSTAALQLAAVIVTNTVYETFLMFLLGYGLVQYPRSLWMQSDLDYYLLRTQMRASVDFKAIGESQLSVSLVVSDVMKTKAEISQYADVKLNDAMDILVAECPPEFRSSKMGKVATNKNGQITIGTLANLRLRLNVTKDRYRMSQGMVGETKLLAYHLEDLTKAKNRTDGVSQIEWSLTGKLSSRSEYQWYIVYRPLFLKIGSVLAFLMSAFSLLGVICSMDGVTPAVSVYFHAVHNPEATATGIAVFILFSLGYTTYVTLWALFQIRLAGFMELVPYKTTPESLSFNVRMVARLAAPLAFFYLGWISENGIKDGPWTANEAPSITTTYNITLPYTVANKTSTHNHTYSPSFSPTIFGATNLPTHLPSVMPTLVPTPTIAPHTPTIAPHTRRLSITTSATTDSPSQSLSHLPSHLPTYSPSVSSAPSYVPSLHPTLANGTTYSPSYSPSFNGSTHSKNRTELVTVVTPGGVPMPSCFSHFYQLQAVSSLKSTFGTFFPVLLFCVMFLIATNVLNYILVLLKADYLQFGAEIVTEAQLKEGKRQLERHKRSTERTVQRVALKDHIGKLMSGQGDGGMLAILMGNRGGARKNEYKRKGANMGDQPLIVEPEALSGTVEKKGGLGKKLGVGAAWKEVYAEVRSPGTILFFADKAASTLSSSSQDDHMRTGKTKDKGGGGPSGELMSLKLRLIVSINVVQKTGKDSSAHLIMELSEGSVDLRFKGGRHLKENGEEETLTGLEEAERWKTLLLLWKDYSIDYASIYPDIPAGTDSNDSDEDKDKRDIEAGQRKRGQGNGNAFDDLDSIVVDGEDGTEYTKNPMMQTTKGASGGGLFGGFFGGGKNKKSVEMSARNATVVERPEGLEGWLQKKGSSGGVQIMGGDWQKRYCRIDEENCCLLVSKTKDQATPAVIDLKLVADIRAYEKGKTGGKKGPDPQRFNLDMGEGEGGGKMYKFKAKDKAEGEKWLAALEDWREYALLTANY